VVHANAPLSELGWLAASSKTGGQWPVLLNGSRSRAPQLLAGPSGTDKLARPGWSTGPPDRTTARTRHQLRWYAGSFITAPRSGSDRSRSHPWSASRPHRPPGADPVWVAASGVA
jgi:hypothetical protein